MERQKHIMPYLEWVGGDELATAQAVASAVVNDGMF